MIFVASAAAVSVRPSLVDVPSGVRGSARSNGLLCHERSSPVHDSPDGAQPRPIRDTSCYHYTWSVRLQPASNFPAKTRRSLQNEAIVYPWRFGQPVEFARTVMCSLT